MQLPVDSNRDELYMDGPIRDETINADDAIAMIEALRTYSHNMPELVSRMDNLLTTCYEIFCEELSEEDTAECISLIERRLRAIMDTVGNAHQICDMLEEYACGADCCSSTEAGEKR